MKRTSIITALLLSVLTANLNAQVQDEYFAPVMWGNQPRNVNWATNPHNSSYVSIPKATIGQLASDIDFSIFTQEEIADLWDMIGQANLIDGFIDDAMPDAFDLDTDAEGNFGAAWKAFYNAEGMYVLFKFVDKNNIATNVHFETALQTREHTRYEAGWQAASQEDTTGIGFMHMNDQYGRFKELGGMKLTIDEQGVHDNTTSLGSTGMWTEAIGGIGVGDVTHIYDANGVEWFILALEFSELVYYIDEWGDDASDNYAQMDPEVENIISFETGFRAYVSDGEELRYWWNGVNDAYKMIYYSGKLEFSTTGFIPVNPPSAYATRVYYCKGESAVQLTANGFNLKWYESADGEALPEAPTPSTSTEGTEDYYVTQTIDAVESDPLMIEVVVYNYEVNPADQHIFCGEAALLSSNSNYKGAGTETFEWTTDFGDFTGDDIEIEPLADGNISLSASTNTGCAVSASAELSILPAGDFIPIATVTAEGVENKNIIRWEYRIASAIDSLYVLAGEAGAEQLDTIGRVDYDAAIQDYTDTREPVLQKDNAYFIELKDRCGMISQNRLEIPEHVRVGLVGAKVTGNSNLLQWSPYKGRDALEYQVLKGETPESLEIIYKTATDFNYYDLSIVTDTVYYRIRTLFSSFYPTAQLNESLSNLIRINLEEGTPIDTMTVYDTIYVTVTDTLYINTSLFGTGPGATPHVIKVYPNPAKDRIFIENQDFTGEEGYMLKIINTTGTLLETYDLDQSLYEIDLSAWPGTGLYFIQLINDQEEIVDIRKIVLE